MTKEPPPSLHLSLIVSPIRPNSSLLFVGRLGSLTFLTHNNERVQCVDDVSISSHKTVEVRPWVRLSHGQETNSTGSNVSGHYLVRRRRVFTVWWTGCKVTVYFTGELKLFHVDILERSPSKTLCYYFYLTLAIVSPEITCPPTSSLSLDDNGVKRSL